MAFALRGIANNRYEVTDTVRKELLALALGRRNGELIIEALTAHVTGEQLELFDDVA